ncbi:unnamed protein product, partial [Rotaria sp. Silwood2]
MIPAITDDPKGKWIFTVENQVRIRLIVGNNEVKELAAREIMKKYNPDITKHSNSWVIGPLMIDSLTAYIVQETNSPVKDVYPFKAINPN